MFSVSPFRRTVTTDSRKLRPPPHPRESGGRNTEPKDWTQVMTRITPDQLIEAAREAACARGGAISLQDFHRITGIGPCHVYRLFAGGWSELRDVAGIERNPSHHQRYADEHLLAEFDRVAQALGRVPTWADINREARISACVLGRRFGGKEGTLEAYRTWVAAGRPPAKQDARPRALYRPPARPADEAPHPGGALPPPGDATQKSPLLDLPLPELPPLIPDDFSSLLLPPGDRIDAPASTSEQHEADTAPQPASHPTDGSPPEPDAGPPADETPLARDSVATSRHGVAGYVGRDSVAASPRKAAGWKPVVYGEPIDFRGLRHAPVNEQGVVYLFGMVACELGFLVEAIHSGFPDCEAKRALDGRRNQWRRVRIEFEFRSRNFRDHGHDPTHCDLIVCWQHNWPDCPLEVLELSQVVAGNVPIRAHA